MFYYLLDPRESTYVVLWLDIAGYSTDRKLPDCTLYHSCICSDACTLMSMAHDPQFPSIAWGALQFRAWDFSRPLLVAPAMNTFMWDSPFTAAHLEALQRLGVTIIPPVQAP